MMKARRDDLSDIFVLKGYYNNNWQVVCEYDGSDNYEQLFIYGNYIDEVIFRGYLAGPSYKYYVHNHLYSPAALVNIYGAVQERYEYDAYGDCSIQDANHEPRTTSHYDNQYYFTGRRVDFLDDGNLTLQYNRNRYYDHYTGRWLTPDPLGINPAGGMYNPFLIRFQYGNGVNLYEYVDSTPVFTSDPTGLIDVDLFEVGLWLGVGGSISANYKTDHKDCRVCDRIIKDGLRKYIVTVEGRIGVGAGGTIKVKGVGLDLVWKGPPALSDRMTGTIQNTRCGGPLNSAKTCKETSLDFGTSGSAGVGPIGIKGFIKGEFGLRVCMVTELYNVYGTLEGCGSVNMGYAIRFFGVKIRGEETEEVPWKELRRIRIFSIPKETIECGETGFACAA